MKNNFYIIISCKEKNNKLIADVALYTSESNLSELDNMQFLHTPRQDYLPDHSTGDLTFDDIESRDNKLKDVIKEVLEIVRKGQEK